MTFVFIISVVFVALALVGIALHTVYAVGYRDGHRDGREGR